MKIYNQNGNLSIMLISMMPCIGLMGIVLLGLSKTQYNILAGQAHCYKASSKAISQVTNLVNYALGKHNPMVRKLIKEKVQLRALAKGTIEPMAQAAIRIRIKYIETQQYYLKVQIKKLIIRSYTTYKMLLESWKLAWKQSIRGRTRIVSKPAAFHVLNKTSLDNISSSYELKFHWKNNIRLNFKATAWPHYLGAIHQTISHWQNLNFKKTTSFECGAEAYLKGKKWTSIITKEI